MNKELLQQAYELGFLRCARWAKRDDLLSDTGSMAYTIDCARDLAAIAQPEQEGDAKDARLNADEIYEILSALDDHNGDDFEPECPSCTAYKKLAAIASQKGAAA